MTRLPLALTLIVAAPLASAQSLRVRTGHAAPASEPQSKWDGDFRYRIGSDYATNVQPRTYLHSLGGTAKYSLTPNWTLSTDLSLQMETLDGKIPKETQETRTEKLNPGLGVEVGYSRPFDPSHCLSLFSHAEPLLDEPSRIEGYRAIVGLGADLRLGFFGRRYQVVQTADVSELINSYDHNLEGESNPDMFYTYRLSQTIRLMPSVNFSYTFGLKWTRRLDAETDYSYKNVFSLTKGWRALTLGFAYENGGFTDDGIVRLWYIDQYRRLAQFTAAYTF